MASQHVTVPLVGSNEALFEFTAQHPPRVLDMAFDKLCAGAEVEHHGVAVAVGQPCFDLRRSNFGKCALWFRNGWRCGVSVRKVLRLQAFQHKHLPSHLRQPRGRHIGAHAFGVAQHDAGTAHRGGVVGLLHELTARSASRAHHMARSKLFGSAYI